MSTAPPPRLDPKQLFDKRFRRDQARLRAYNQLLEQIHQRIYTTSQLTGNASYITYTIPPFIFGLPKIDLEDCVVYLVYMLRQSGYEVKYTYPNLLFISWKHHERSYFLNQNPIMQAMIPPEVKKSKRKKRNKVWTKQNQLALHLTYEEAMHFQNPESLLYGVQWNINLQTPLCKKYKNPCLRRKTIFWLIYGTTLSFFSYRDDVREIA